MLWLLHKWIVHSRESLYPHRMKLDRYKNHDIEVVIDKLVVTEKDDRRLKQSVATAMRQGDGLLMILDAQTESIRHYRKIYINFH